MRNARVNEMTEQGLAVRRQVLLPVTYKGVKLDCGYRIDAVLEETVILEFKTVEKLLAVHEAQLLFISEVDGIESWIAN